MASARSVSLAFTLFVVCTVPSHAFRTSVQGHTSEQAFGVGLYGQCGGKAYSGPTQCESGLVCEWKNEWYSGCFPGQGGNHGHDDGPGDVPNDGVGTEEFEKGSGVVQKYGRLQIKNGRLVDKNETPVYLKGMSFFWSMWTPDYWTAENVRIMAREWNVSVLRAAVGVTDDDPNNDVRGNPALNYKLLETVVNACIEEDIYVIIDWHDHEANKHKDAAIAFFEKYGQMYGHKEHILWETWNEPNAASSGVDWLQHCKPYHEAVVPIIRKHSDNVIILGSPDWSRKVDDAARNPVRGENLAYSLHFYTNYHKQDIRNVADWALQHGIAIFVSEWGLWNSGCNNVPCDISYLDNADEGDRWMDWCDRNKVSWVAWAIYDKGETPAITTQFGVIKDSVLTPAGKYYKRQMLK